MQDGATIMTTSAIGPVATLIGERTTFDDPQSIAQQMSDALDKSSPNDSRDVTRSEFAQAFDKLPLPPHVSSQGDDAIFAQLDTNDVGRVSKSDVIQGLLAMIGDAGAGPASHAHHARAPGANDADDDQLPSAWSVISTTLSSR
jgi:hypothetical protein